jgi:putative heme-binding domain-containing protein
LAQQHDRQDRWYLEALGIAADQQWDRFLACWLDRVGSDWKQPAGRDIIWRSRAAVTADRLAELIADPATPVDELPRLFRSLDFVSGRERDEVIARLAFPPEPQEAARSQLVLAEALRRLPSSQIQGRPDRQERLLSVLDSLGDPAEFIELVGRFNLVQRYDHLLRIAQQQNSASDGIAAIRLLLAKRQDERLREALQRSDTDQVLQTLAALGNSADNRAVDLLEPLLASHDQPLDVRREALRGLARIRRGAEQLLTQAEAGELSTELVATAAAELNRVPWNDLQERAQQLFPLAPSKDKKPLPSIRDLARRRGDVERGRVVFRKQGTCAKCHLVDGEGEQVGPPLSEIGGKLSREALFESILYPSAGISHSYETYAIQLADGNVASGVLVSETDQDVEIKTNEAIVRRFLRSEIEQIVKQPISLMPADLHQSLTEEELVDLVEYLTTLRKDGS